jgi:hypothetical protein
MVEALAVQQNYLDSNWWQKTLFAVVAKKTAQRAR